MSAQIDAMIDRARLQGEEARSLVADRQDEFVERPTDDRWSAAEQIAHIALTDEPYLSAIDDSVREARIRGRTGDGPFNGGLLGNWFARWMEPPVRRRTRTFRKLHPPSDLEADRVVGEFGESRAALISSLESARGVDLDRAKIRSPFLKLLKMPVFSAYGVLLAHADRHLWLARETLEGRRGD